MLQFTGTWELLHVSTADMPAEESCARKFCRGIRRCTATEREHRHMIITGKFKNHQGE